MDMNPRTPVRKHDYASAEKLFGDPASYQDSEYKAKPLPRLSADDSRPLWKRGGLFLSKDEELWLARKWRRRGDRAARDRILKAHLPLVHSCARRVFPKLSAQDAMFKEAVSAGCVGMTQAFTKFDPDLGYRFATFAMKWILGAINSDARQVFSVVKTPRGVPAKTDGGMRPDDVDEAPNPEDLLIRSQQRAAEDAALSAAIEVLDWRARRIFRARRLTEPAVTLEVLGIELGLSRERVRQIENAAADRVKAAVLNYESGATHVAPEREGRGGINDGLTPERRYRMLIDKNYSPELAAALLNSPHQRQIFCAFEADNRAFARGAA